MRRRRHSRVGPAPTVFVASCTGSTGSELLEPNRQQIPVGMGLRHQVVQSPDQMAARLLEAGSPRNSGKQNDGRSTTNPGLLRGQHRVVHGRRLHAQRKWQERARPWSASATSPKGGWRGWPIGWISWLPTASCCSCSACLPTIGNSWRNRSRAHATYILRAMQTRASNLDRALLRHLVDHQQAGRLRIRLRDPCSQVHAKLYLIQTASHAWKGLAESSNLSESGLTKPGEFNQVLDVAAAAQASRWMSREWNAPPSQRADDVWRELLNMATPVPEAGPRDQPTVPRPRAVRSQRRHTGKADGRRTRQSGCWELVLGLPLVAGLLLILLSLPG